MNTPNYPIILQALGHLFLFSILTVAFHVAYRRTSLLGLRLFFYFAAGKLCLWILGASAMRLISIA